MRFLHRMHREHPGGQGNRAPVTEVILRHAGERDLSHQLAAKSELVVGVRQVGEGLEGSITGTRDHRVDVADFLEHGPDDRRVVEL